MNGAMRVFVFLVVVGYAMAQTGATLRSLNEAFAKFSDDMVEPQMQTLDIDLKVVNDALKSDLEKTA